MPDIIHEKKSDVEVLSIKHFYKLFQKEKKSYDPSLFCIGEKTKAKRKQKVTYKLYRQIVITYLTFYFYNVYMKQVAIYFPLGGFIKKVVYAKWQENRLNKNGLKKGSNGSIGFFWYLRPSQKMHYMLKFIKLTGSTSRMAQLENIFLKNYDKDLLPIFKHEITQAQKHKTLFQCTQE